MLRLRLIVLLLCLIMIGQGLIAQRTTRVDICVYGGTSAGVMAAYTAKKMGKSVLLIEPGMHLGGLSSGGLGFTDIGNKYAISGLALDFYRRVGQHYGRFEQWIFEPHVAEDIFKGYIQRGKVPVQYNTRLFKVTKTGNNIISIILENSAAPSTATSDTVYAKMFIDCSYEGDLMARAGVSFTTGREANSVYNETFNGVQMRNKHQFADSIDPYKVKGDAGSGLLWGISSQPAASTGSGDKKIQAYNFRICLTSDSANQLPITQPPGYDPGMYELLVRVLETPGHTLDHISYVFDGEKAVFAADTLFSIGCGRVFEGTYPMMWDSLLKLRALPDDFKLYCGHEYTASNVKFALTVDGDNPALKARAEEVTRLRAENKPTIPVLLGEEKKANVFLRADEPSVAAKLHMKGASGAEVFGELRERKNKS